MVSERFYSDENEVSHSRHSSCNVRRKKSVIIDNDMLKLYSITKDYLMTVNTVQQKVGVKVQH